MGVGVGDYVSVDTSAMDSGAPWTLTSETASVDTSAMELEDLLASASASVDTSAMESGAPWAWW